MKALKGKGRVILPAFMALSLAVTGISCSNKKAGLPEKTVPVSFAGCRCSVYGIRPFPTQDEWFKYVEKIAEQFPGSAPSFVWIVGSIEGNGTAKSCIINFPLDKPIAGVNSFPVDQNEEFLTECDKRGYKVWLQVEPGDCDLVELARQTMKRYKKHSSVMGFGVDVEWHKPGGTDGFGSPLTDELAEAVDKAVKAADPSFSVFVKHWDVDWLPPTYRGVNNDMIFVDDSQQHGSLESMKNTFDGWAQYYAPNPVIFQIGYESDIKIWNPMENPVAELGNLLAEGCEDGQHCGIVWVDFSLKKVMKKLK